MEEIADQAAFLNKMFPNGFPKGHPFYEPPGGPALESHKMYFIDKSEDET